MRNLGLAIGKAMYSVYSTILFISKIYKSYTNNLFKYRCMLYVVTYLFDRVSILVYIHFLIWYFLSLGVIFVTFCHFLSLLKCNVSGFGDITPSFKDELLYDLYRVAVLIWIFFGLAYIGGLGKDCPFLSLFNLVWPIWEKACLESEKVSNFFSENTNFSIKTELRGCVQVLHMYKYYFFISNCV